MEHIKTLVALYLVFSGRTGRKAFWISSLILLVLAAVVFLFIALAAKIVVVMANRAPIDFDFRFLFFIIAAFRFLLLCVLVFLPLSALITRRFHDAGLSGVWFLILAAIGIASYFLSWRYASAATGIVLLIVLLMPSAKLNKYGAAVN